MSYKIYGTCLLLLLGITLVAQDASRYKKAIVIGASSGMGREIAKLLSQEGYIVGLAARRMSLLHSLQAELMHDTYIKQIDASKPGAREQLEGLINDMNGLDLIVISISSYLDNRNSAADINPDFPYGYKKTWIEKERTIDVDAKGFIALAEVAFDFFKRQNHGHFVGISSTSGLRGSASSPVYSGAKAFISYYMEGMRNQMVRDGINVQVTDVVPGFVAVEHSPLAEDPNAYWEITTEQAGKTILEGIHAQQNVVYVPKKTWFLALALKLMPDCLYQRYLNWM